MGRASVPTPAVYPAFFFVLEKAVKSAGNAVISTLLMHRSYGLQHLRHKRPTRRNRGLPDGAAITTLGAFRTFTNIPGPGVRTANFAAFGSWSEALLKDTESLRNSDALMRLAVPRRRGPAGLRRPTPPAERTVLAPISPRVQLCLRRPAFPLSAFIPGA